jgi:branched-chain amino acid transport system ATP-binding protein
MEGAVIARMADVLKAEGLVKKFDGLRAVDNVDLKLSEGEVVALIGPNGAGKTTLLNLLSGQLRPEAGRIFLAGREITAWPAHRRARAGLARTFQIPALFPTLTAGEHVEAAALRGRLVPPKLAPLQGMVNEWLARCHLTDKAFSQAQALSHGDKRLLELAMALASEPCVLLLDEPAAGLSPAETRALIALVRELRAQMPEVAILIVEHDMDVVFELAERVIVMHRGRVLAEGSPSEVQQNPDVQAVYLGAMP